MEFAEEFNGVWASASLLHVPRAQLDVAFRRILRAARNGGVIYMSFKHGTGQRERDRRLFTDLTPEDLAAFVGEFPEAAILRTWQTGDVWPGRPEERWANALVRKFVERAYSEGRRIPSGLI